MGRHSSRVNFPRSSSLKPNLFRVNVGRSGWQALLLVQTSSFKPYPTIVKLAESSSTISKMVSSSATSSWILPQDWLCDGFSRTSLLIVDRLPPQTPQAGSVSLLSAPHVGHFFNERLLPQE